MPKFGKRSMRNLLTCVRPLRTLAFEIVKDFDCSFYWGRRGRWAQENAFKKGWTTKHYPSSKHNVKAPTLSTAMDLVPYPFDWDNEARNYYFSGYVRRAAKDMGILIRHGSDWDGDYDIDDQVLRDPCHFEYIGDL